MLTEKDQNGNTMMLVAAQQGLRRICKFLLRRGADDADVSDAHGAALEAAHAHRARDARRAHARVARVDR